MTLLSVGADAFHAQAVVTTYASLALLIFFAWRLFAPVGASILDSDQMFLVSTR